MTTEALIDQMLELMDGGRGWCQKTLALNRRGEDMAASDPTAVAFCVQGAALRALGKEGSWQTLAWVGELKSEPAWTELEERLRRALGAEDRPWSVARWNNTRQSYGEIKAGLEAARENGK